MKNQQLNKGQVPVLYARGTHYDVGLSMGRTFAGLINSYLKDWKWYEETLLPLYESFRGRQKYDETLEVCEKRFPGYMDEIRGIADGANLPFYKIFLLHIDALIEPEEDEEDSRNKGKESTFGCTAILSNAGDVLLGHTEDGADEVSDRFYIVAAQILDKEGNIVEDFATLTYPGSLPGSTMGFNKHGIVHSVNAINPAKRYSGRTPVNFICRAILGARNKAQVLSILKDEGVGIADSLTLNLISVNEEEGPVVLNIEVGPGSDTASESRMDIHEVTKGTTYAHCNRYLRLDIPEIQCMTIKSSSHRQAAIEKLPAPNTPQDIKRILSDRSDETFPVFRKAPPVSGAGEDRDYATTVAVGLFDVAKKTWSIYTSPPDTYEPVVVLHMNY